MFDQLQEQELRAKTERPRISWFLNQTTESLFEIKIRTANMLLVFFTICSSWSLPRISTVSEEKWSRDWIAESSCHFFLYKIKSSVWTISRVDIGPSKKAVFELKVQATFFLPRRFERAIRKRPNTVRCLAVKSAFARNTTSSQRERSCAAK